MLRLLVELLRLVIKTSLAVERNLLVYLLWVKWLALVLLLELGAGVVVLLLLLLLGKLLHIILLLLLLLGLLDEGLWLRHLGLVG